MNPDENISLLIEKCKKNNQEAQFEIYKKFYKNMFNTAFRILNNKEEAEDVIQECFLKAFSELHNLLDNKAFPGWLKQLVIRTCLNTIQKNKKLYAVSFNEEPLEMIVIEENLDLENLDFENKQKIGYALQQIKPNYRVAISLRYIEGFDLEEITNILNISNQNCRTLLSRAKNALKQKINEYENAI